MDVRACMHRCCSLAGLKAVMHAYVLLLLPHAVLCHAMPCYAMSRYDKFAASLQAWSLEQPMLCCCHAMIHRHSKYAGSKQAYIRFRRVWLLASLQMIKRHTPFWHRYRK